MVVKKFDDADKTTLTTIETVFNISQTKKGSFEEVAISLKVLVVPAVVKIQNI
jgi:hypothetical protein